MVAIFENDVKVMWNMSDGHVPSMSNEKCELNISSLSYMAIEKLENLMK